MQQTFLIMHFDHWYPLKNKWVINRKKILISFIQSLHSYACYFSFGLIEITTKQKGSCSIQHIKCTLRIMLLGNQEMLRCDYALDKTNHSLFISKWTTEFSLLLYINKLTRTSTHIKEITRLAIQKTVSWHFMLTIKWKL